MSFELQWRETPDDEWEPQQDFPTREAAHAFVAEQPDGGAYRIVEFDYGEKITR